MSKLSDYKHSIEHGVREAFGHFPEVYLDKNHVTVSCDTNGSGITFSQIMALREVFGAEFNILHEHSDGDMSDSGTWWPGESRIVFTFTRVDNGN